MKTKIRKAVRPVWTKQKINGRMQRVTSCPTCRGGEYYLPKTETRMSEGCPTCNGRGMATRGDLIAAAMKLVSGKIDDLSSQIRGLKAAMEDFFASLKNDE